MAKSYSLVFIVLFLLTLGSCQSLEQIPMDYLQPADLSFPPQLRKVAIVNNTGDVPDNKLITETEKIKEGTPLISRETAYANGDPKTATESLAEEIAQQNYFDEDVYKRQRLYRPSSAELRRTSSGISGRYHFWYKQ